MDEKTRAYMDSLKKALEDLPQSEVKDALEYYEEYLNDAIEAGKNPEETLKQLGPPETVSAMIRAEASFERVRKNPGIKSFSKVAGNGMKAFTKPVAVFFMALFIIILYGMVILLYAGAAVSVVAALDALAGAGY
ncbi:MAG: DUF1700 domain-containing protein [Clostridiales bacterium]|nr:DUF1700 domain-containing protein [Clostridiales bacterium]